MPLVRVACDERGTKDKTRRRRGLTDMAICYVHCSICSLLAMQLWLGAALCVVPSLLRLLLLALSVSHRNSSWRQDPLPTKLSSG